MPLCAQVVVHVDGKGFVLAGVEVALWNDATRIGAARSDGLGNARFAVSPAQRAGVYITARRVGYAPVRTILGATDTVSIVMKEIAASLPVLAVQSRTLHCPISSDASAEQLWKSAAARYAHNASEMFVSWRGSVSNERVEAGNRGFGDELGNPAYGGLTSFSSAPALLQHPAPFALYERHVSLLGEQWRWRYSPLESAAVDYFARDDFLATHALTILATTDGISTLGFCPRSKKETEIEGELQIAADSTLRAARWQFLVTHDDDDAGGEAWFGVAQFNGASYLVATRGSTWRRADRGFYLQDRFERMAWAIGRTREEASASLPRE